MPRFIILLFTLLIVRIVIFYVQAENIQTRRVSSNKEFSVVANIKDNIRKTYLSVLDTRDADLLMGMVFGESLDNSSKQKFIQTGVIHVVAASGMNISMLSAILLGILVSFMRRQHAIILTSAVILLYTALASFQPSIVRAAIMALFAFGAGLTGRQNTSFIALFFAASAMIFWDPGILVSISFILSFSATLGIILLDPILKKRPFAHSFFEDFRTTIAAQIATTPIIIFFFGTYSPISIIVNFLVLWTVPPLMVLGGIAMILGSISQILAAPIIYLAMPLLLYFQVVVDFFAKGSAVMELKNIPWSIVIGYYLILFSGILLAQRKK